MESYFNLNKTINSIKFSKIKKRKKYFTMNVVNSKPPPFGPK